MEKQKQIYLQLDTSSLKLQAIINSIGQPTPITFTPKQILQHTMINESGSMTLGTNVQAFTTNIHTDTQVCFTMVPLQLFTTDQLAFNYHPANIPEGYSHIPNTPLLIPSSITSLFSVPTDSKNWSATNFNVEVKSSPETISIEYKICATYCAADINGGTPIDFVIDPKLQVSQ